MTSSKPYQYIKGWVEFYKLKFKVTPDVLIPRPETELLVDEVLVLSRTHLNQGRTLTIFDIGTGCGNIAISIAKNLSVHPRGANINIIATDISQKALKIAKQNAKLHGIKDKIKFVKSDLLSDLNYTLYPKPYVRHSAEESSAYTLIIVTNLPYIPSARIPYLDASVKDFEPKIALDGGKDGFKLYRKLFQQISRQRQQHRMLQLKLMVGEVDYTHGELAVNEAYKYFPQAEIEVKTDLAKKQRILLIRQFT